MTNFRIVLEDNLLPVQVFFNAIPDRSFIDVKCKVILSHKARRRAFEI